MTPYYKEDGITIYCGDARDVIPLLPKADLVLTDPPYGVSLAGKRTKRDASLSNTGYSGIFEDTPEYIDSTVLPIIRLCIERFHRVVVTPGVRHLFKYPEPSDVGCVFNPAGAGRGRWGFNCFNPILYYGKDPYIQRGMGGRPNGFSEVAAGDGSIGHPCPKPLRWMLWLVNKASLPGDLILDPFMGSGTTLIASKRLGRSAIGVEIEESYCRIAIDRLRQDVLPLAAPVDDPIQQDALFTEDRQ
jgi:DNA modification methylase